MDVALRERGLTRPIAQVPSARETIDITLATKARVGGDYLQRFPLAPELILLIGDSFQPGGNDEPLLEGFQNARAVHVGDLAPAKGVHWAAHRGPVGVIETLRDLV